MFITSLCSELGNKMALGGKVALMGILVVFSLLAVIVIILEIMDAINKRSVGKPKKVRNKRKKSADDNKNGNDTISAPQITVANNIDNNATVAAIIAALSVVLGDETAANPDAQFVVKKIKKLNFRR